MPQSSLYLSVPREIAVCPYCQSSLYLWVDEWDAETGQPTPAGAHIDCDARDDAEGELFDIGFDDSATAMGLRVKLRRHEYMPYVYWLPVEVQVWDRFGQYCRVAGDALTHEPPSLPPAEEMRQTGAMTLPGLEEP